MTGTSRPHLLCLGHGYVANHLAASLAPEGWRITGTSRSVAGAEAMRAQGVEPVVWPGGDIGPALADATHVVSSVPPLAGGVDPVADLIETAVAGGQLSPRLQWLALLSTTGVYGDRGGAWVDETAEIVPAGHRGALRADQERRWFAMGRERGLPVHVFRLAGIYGPGRSAFDRLRDGTARRIVKPGQVFSRIHVDDIVTVLRASMAAPAPGTAYNVADDLPGPPQDVIEEAARMLGLPVPPDIPFEAADLSPMAASFYADNKRVSNARIKRDLGIVLRYPDYRAGLAGILAAGG